MTISSWLNFGRPAPPGRGSATGRKILAPPYYCQRAMFASPPSAFFIQNLILNRTLSVSVTSWTGFCCQVQDRCQKTFQICFRRGRQITTHRRGRKSVFHDRFSIWNVKSIAGRCAVLLLVQSRERVASSFVQIVPSPTVRTRNSADSADKPARRV